MAESSQKNITKWNTVESLVKRAHDHFVRRAGFISEQDFIAHLIRHACTLELRRKKRDDQKGETV